MRCSRHTWTSPTRSTMPISLSAGVLTKAPRYVSRNKRKLCPNPTRFQLLPTEHYAPFHRELVQTHLDWSHHEHHVSCNTPVGSKQVLQHISLVQFLGNLANTREPCPNSSRSPQTSSTMPIHTGSLYAQCTSPVRIRPDLRNP